MRVGWNALEKVEMFINVHSFFKIIESIYKTFLNLEYLIKKNWKYYRYYQDSRIVPASMQKYEK